MYLQRHVYQVDIWSKNRKGLTGLDFLLQLTLDLTFMQNSAKQNKGYKLEIA